MVTKLYVNDEITLFDGTVRSNMYSTVGTVLVQCQYPNTIYFKYFYLKKRQCTKGASHREVKFCVFFF